MTTSNLVYTLAELASLLQLTYQNPSKTTDIKIYGVNTLQKATIGEISFLDNKLYRKYLKITKASAVILSPEHAVMSPVPVLVSPNPYLAFAKIASLFNQRPLPVVGIHPTAIVGKNCMIRDSARIGAYCVIGDNCQIGENTCLWPHVTLYDDTVIGDHVIIHSGAVIGSDGFGNARDGTKWYKVPQLGRVVIGNYVEIGANTTIDRGALDDTIIEEDVRLDNQIQIAHNVKIGAHTAIAACVGIAGSATIGKHCLIGGGVGINGHVDICDHVMIAGMSGVTKSIKEPGMYASTPVVQKSHEWRKMTVRLRQLDKLFDRVSYLEKHSSDQKREVSS